MQRAVQWLHSRGLGSMLFPPCYHFPSLFLLFSFSFFSSFLETLQRTGKTSRPFSQERKKESVAMNCSSGTYRITMVLLAESIGRPVESHSRMCLRTWGLGFLSELKTNSSHLCHRWHNNHLCRRLFFSFCVVLPLAQRRSLSAFFLFFFLFLFFSLYLARSKMQFLPLPCSSGFYLAAQYFDGFC